MRLYVLEVFVTNLLAVNCLLANPKDPMAMIVRLSKQMIDGARVKGFADVVRPCQICCRQNWKRLSLGS